MCGVVSVIKFLGNGELNPVAFDKMMESISHRGPDGSGIHLGESVYLGHQRLSIIDVEAPPQPLSYRNFKIIYNGELYNHLELKSQLISLGHTFNSNCDTDVFLAAYSEWGVSSFKKFNGMFSAVIYDSKKEEMIVVRDRFGVKPLYVGDGPNGIRLFASEQQAIEAYTENLTNSYQWALNYDALDNYLSLGYIVEPKTIKLGIRQVLPGNCEVHSLKTGTVKKIEYWNIGDAINNSQDRLTNEFGRDLLSNAVQRQSVADVEVGTFLSGGLDSSLITSILCSGQEKDIHSYSAGFTNSGFDEIPDAMDFASKMNIMHHHKYFDSDLIKKTSDIPKIYGGPFADNAALPTYELSKEASKSVKVLLSGDGADELFFGYKNHRALFAETAIKGVLPSFIKDPTLKWISEWYPNSPKMPRILRAKSTLSSLSQSLSEGYCSAMGISSRDTLNSIYSEKTKSELSGFTTAKEFAQISSYFENEDPMKVMQYLDFKTYLPGSVLTKVDRATMRAGVEARVPFLDNDLSSAVLSQSSSLNLGWGKHKTQLRAWAKPWLSELSRSRVKKSFTSPLDDWFRVLQYHTYCRIIMSDKLIESGIFNIDNLQKIMDEHYLGKANHGPTLWSISILSKSL